MKIIFNCHTEYDLENKFGKALRNLQENQSYNHLPLLFRWINDLKIPMNYALGVGGPFGINLIEFLKDKKFIFNELNELGIHFHAEDYADKIWQFKKFLTKEDYKYYYDKFSELLNHNPNYTVFGKWYLDKNNFEFLKYLGIAKDASWIDSKTIIKSPFFINEILEIPVLSYGGRHLNPFTKLSHFFILRKIIKEYNKENLIIQIGFHSYDLFDFSGNPKLRLTKKIIFKNILKLARKFNIEIINLSQLQKNNFKDLEKIKMPFMGKVLNLIGH